MKPLTTYKAQDVEPDAPSFDYDSFKPRTAARAIVFDGEKVALVYISEHNYFMLPGGGIDDDDVTTGIAREIQEELGCEIEVIAEVGSIDVYFDRWQQRQTDYCYTTRKRGASKDTALNDFEIEEGHKVVWATNLEEAMRLVKEAVPENRDGKLVQARDLFFLEKAAKNKVGLRAT